MQEFTSTRTAGLKCLTDFNNQFFLLWKTRTLCYIDKTTKVIFFICSHKSSSSKTQSHKKANTWLNRCSAKITTQSPEHGPRLIHRAQSIGRTAEKTSCPALLCSNARALLFLCPKQGTAPSLVCKPKRDLDVCFCNAPLCFHLPGIGGAQPKALTTELGCPQGVPSSPWAYFSPGAPATSSLKFSVNLHRHTQ